MIVCLHVEIVVMGVCVSLFFEQFSALAYSGFIQFMLPV